MSARDKELFPSVLAALEYIIHILGNILSSRVKLIPPLSTDVDEELFRPALNDLNKSKDIFSSPKVTVTLKEDKSLGLYVVFS